MPNVQVRVVLPYESGLPSDVAVNTFSVITPTDETDVTPAFVDFYNDPIAGGSIAISDILAPYIVRGTGQCRFELYEIDLAGGPMGSPQAVVPFTLDSTSVTTSLPAECAIVTSFASGTAPGVSAARRRGRVYLGPLAELTLGGSDGPPNISEGICEIVAGATERLQTDLIALGASLCVWSRTDEALYPVVRGWVDNDFDTMRSREADATARISWSLGL